MSYLPHTKTDISEMLAVIGVDSLEGLFEDVPENVRFPVIDLPEPLSQLEVGWLLEEMSEDNLPGSKYPIFLGAGSYNHYSPSVVNHTILRGEFLTAYTPYQPEVSQGTLQAIFEYQSMICALTGMEVANASHYDGATSLAEAVVMAISQFRGKRTRIVMSAGVHPEYREVTGTYTQGMGLDVVSESEPDADMDRLIELINENTALVAVAYPNFFGEITKLDDVIRAAHASGALVCVVTDPIALGLLKPPGLFGADIVVGEGQSLGIPMSLGGPYLGFFATREKYVRKMAGRLVGETVDVNGNSGFVLTLATREQHIRRGGATSNICTNQGLMALAASVYLSVMGKHGLRKVAELCYHKAHYAASQIDSLSGYRLVTENPFFKEFVVECPISVSEVTAFLLEEHGIIGGFDLEKVYPERANQMLLAVTEMNTRNEIDALIDALREVAA